MPGRRRWPNTHSPAVLLPCRLLSPRGLLFLFFILYYFVQ